MSTRTGILERSLAILALFTETRVEWRVPDVAEAVDLPVPTAYRLVGTLVAQGLLRPTAGGGHRLGSAALDLGRRAAAGLDLAGVVGRELRALAEATQETCVLSVLDEAARVGVCVDRVDSAQPLRLSVEVGERIPLHAGAASKALLAFGPVAVREAVLAGPLPRLGPATLTSPAAVQDELDAVRAAGYAVSREETDEGAWGVAAPILGVGGVLLGSIGMAAPLVRCTPEALEAARVDVLASARRAESALGAGTTPGHTISDTETIVEARA
jgi:DNA-binding IclR family transcriptional regulator